MLASALATRSDAPARLSLCLRPDNAPYSGNESTAKYTSPSFVAYAFPLSTSLSVIAMISAMCRVARGSSVGGKQFKDATSSLNASTNRSTSASHVSPFSAARLMILSSTSVKLRTYVTSYPRLRNCL